MENRKRKKQEPHIARQVVLLAGGTALIAAAAIGVFVKSTHRPAGKADAAGVTAVSTEGIYPTTAVAAGVSLESTTATAAVPSPSLRAEQPQQQAEAAVIQTFVPEVQANAEVTPAAKQWDTPMDRYHLDDNFWEGCPPRDVQLLTPNEYSRPQDALDEVNDIVIHYVDQPGSSAQANRDYFESLQDGSRSASSHFIIDMDGTIIQCIPLGEVAYASNNRNYDTISIENCHPDDSGKFTDETYLSCVDLAAWLCYAFEITPDHVIRHYDVTEKLCPIYYVNNPDAWEEMKADIADRYAYYEEQYGKRQ